MTKSIVLVSVLFLAACGMSEEDRAALKAWSDSCRAGNQGACQVLSSYYAAHGQARAAGMANFTAATNNTANWAIQQQNTRTYSGGSGRGEVCNVNSITGQRFCY